LIKIITKHYCDNCKTELKITTKENVSDKITEIVSHDLPLKHFYIHDIYELIEGKEKDIITYDYYQCYIWYQCSKCGNKYDLNGYRIN